MNEENNTQMTGNGNGRSFKKATAFLNVRIQGSDGEMYSLHKGIPLHADGSALEQGLIVVDDVKLAELVDENRIELSIHKVNDKKDPVAL